MNIVFTKDGLRRLTFAWGSSRSRSPPPRGSPGEATCTCRSRKRDGVTSKTPALRGPGPRGCGQAGAGEDLKSSSQIYDDLVKRGILLERAASTSSSASSASRPATG